MKNTTSLVTVLAAFIAIGATLAAVYWVGRAGLDAIASLIGGPEQIIVALLAASVMGFVGFQLTMKKGNLGSAGQYEKISVWAALLLSIVSAITTSLGLLLVLSANQATGSILLIGMALLLGIGIQLSMLMYALKIGEGIQDITALNASNHEEDDIYGLNGHQEASRRSFPILQWGLIAALVVFGGSLLYGLSLLELLEDLFSAVFSEQRDTNRDTHFWGAIFLGIAVILAVQVGLLKRMGTLSGVVLSLGIYSMLLLFSSGFGYLSYFMSAQTDEVRAVNRDNIIETDTVALVNKIRKTANSDVQETLAQARSGEAWDDLSERIDILSRLFTENQGKLDSQVEAFKTQRELKVLERQRRATDINDAKVEAQNAQLAVDNAKSLIVAAEASQTRQLPGLQTDLAAAEKDRNDAEEGRDGTGVKKCGPNCKRAKARIESIGKRISELTANVTTAKLSEARAQTALTQTQQNVEFLNTGDGGGSLDDPLPPSVVDRASFTTPVAAYTVDPTKANLTNISSTCSITRQMFIAIEIAASDIPTCEVDRIENLLDQHDKSKITLARMEDVCKRTPEEEQLEADALLNRGAPDIDVVPPHLVNRLAWLSRCFTAANSGSENMTELAAEVNQFKSEYTSPGYDVRRVLRALKDENDFALFAAIMALVIDTAILFAGFAANAQKGRELRGDHRLITPDRIAERVRKALSTVSREKPQQAALSIAQAWHPRSADEVQKSPYTHTLELPPPDSYYSHGIKLILAAAGSYYARYEQKGEQKYWLLHSNFVALIVEHSTAADKSDTSQSSRTMDVDIMPTSEKTGFTATVKSGMTRLPGRVIQEKQPQSQKTENSKKIDFGPI